ncbi:MAG: hypothetical protein LBT80_05115 [Lactobacillaceae bacterium]|nr:hypothetical protein [Lactobacillaceae bacterium]
MPAEEADYPAYTEEADNVAILAGAHVAEDKLVKVALTPDQTFAVSHDGTATENVAYKVKISDNEPIANSNIADTSQVLQATAA